MSAVYRYGDHIVCLADGQEIHLRPKEADLLALLAKHHGRVVTHETQIRNLWQTEAEQDRPGAETTRRAHLHNLREKLKGTGLRIENEQHLGERLTGELTVDWSIR